MKLSKTALLALRGTDKPTKQRMADKLNSSLNSIYRWIKENEINGELTKASAVQAISEETGMPVDQILEEDTATETVSNESQSN